MFSALGGISKKMIIEMQPIPYPSAYMLFLAIYFFLFANCYFLKNIKTKAHTVFLFVGLAIISISSVRNLFLFLIVGAFSIAEILNDFLNENNKIDIELSRNWILFLRFAIVLGICILFFIHPHQEYIDNTYYPVEATQYIINNIDLSKYTLYN